MPRAALLFLPIAVLTWAAGAVADDAPDEVAFKAAIPHAQWENPKPGDTSGTRRLRFDQRIATPEMIELAHAFLAKFPQSPRVADVLQTLVGYTNLPPDERIAAFMRIRDELPAEYVARDLAAIVAEHSSGLFDDGVETSLAPSEAIYLSPRTSQPAVATLYYIPTGLYLDALLDLKSERTPEQCVLTAPRARWESLGSFTRGTGRDTRIAVKGLQRIGWYVLEQTICGITRTRRLEVQTLNHRTQRHGHDLVVYALDDDRKPLANVTLTTPTATIAPAPDGLMRTTINAGTYLVLTQGEERLRFYAEPAEDAADRALLHVSTDRPLYRPGHTVQYKALCRDRHAGRLAVPAGAPPAVVQIVDPDDRVLSRTVVAWSATGSISGSFVLAAEPRLGHYGVVVAVDGDVTERASFDVLAYAKPEFAVTAATEGPPARPGASVSLRVRAQYYFGAPVAGAEVEWSAQPISRNWWSYLRRGDGVMARAPFEDPYRWYYARAVTPFEDEYAGYEEITGSGRLGADGSLLLTLTPPEYSDLVAWNLTGTVVDSAHRAAELDARVELPGCDYSMTAGTHANMVAAGVPLAIRARVAATTTAAVKGREVELAVFRVRDADDGGFGGQRTIYDPIALERGTTDAAGLVRFEVRPRNTGRLGYRVRIADDQDREAEAWGSVVVLPHALGAPHSAAWIPWSTDDLDVLPERTVYTAGATARILVHTETVPARALITVGGARLFEARWIDLVQKEQLVEVALPQQGPNAYVSVWATSGQNEFTAGVELAIVPVERLLDVVVRLEATTLAPRGKARLVVETRQGGKAVAAEVALSLVDLALLALRDDKTPSLASIFEPFTDEPDGVDTTRSFRDEFRSASSGSVVATFAADDGDALEAAPPTTRKHFPDTWHWDAHLITGADGKASLELDVPDALTRWRVLARATAGPDGFGEVETEVRVTQPTVLRLVAPRFLVQGDKATVTTVLTSEVAGKFAVAVTAAGVTAPAVEIELIAGGSVRLEWPVAPADAGTMVLTAKAVSTADPKRGDAVELAIPIHANTTRLEEMASGAVRPRWAAELSLPADAAAKDAWIEVHVAEATSLESIREALPYLADFPYGCVEQTMSRFLPTLVVLRASERLKLPVPPALGKQLPEMVSQGLQRLYHFQHEDGGWGWWEHDATDPGMTAYALYGLLVARDAGVFVEPTVLERGLGALRDMEATPEALCVRTMGGEDTSELRDAMEPGDDTARAWLVLAGRKALAADLPGRPPRQATGDAIARVALVIRALALNDPKDARIDGLVEWLGLQRRGGKWVSTLDSAHAIYALCEVCTSAAPNAIAVMVNGQAVPLVGGTLKAPAVAGANGIVVTQTATARLAAAAFLRYPAKAAPPKADAPLAVVRRIRIGDQELPTGAQIAAGEEVEVDVEVTARVDAARLLVECPIPAGCEATVDAGAYDEYARLELRDDRVCAAVSMIAKGESFHLRFRLRALQPGAYHLRPATAAGMYDPTVAGTSEPGALRIVER